MRAPTFFTAQASEKKHKSVSLQCGKLKERKEKAALCPESGP
jgi:hypothetical protein